MFHTITPAMQARMTQLEEADIIDREDGTPLLKRLRQIPPETGKLLAILCASTPKGDVLEIGTSAGYSSMWISLACATRGDKLTTFEVLDEKVALARQTFAETGITERVNLIHADARTQLADYPQIAFCFLDAEKDIYDDCYEAIISQLVPGGVMVADNVISHQSTLQAFVDRAEADQRIDALVVPIGMGVLVCRKLSR